MVSVISCRLSRYSFMPSLISGFARSAFSASARTRVPLPWRDLVIPMLSSMDRLRLTVLNDTS